MTTRRLLSTSLLVVALAIDVCVAGDGPRLPKKHIMDEGPAEPRPTSRPSGSSVSSGGITWELVDTMQNPYGMMSNRVDPLTYDPVSGYVGLVHRGKSSYALGSGELWYNTSPDGSLGSWSRISSLNGGAPILSRYPSAWIASGAGAGSELFTYSAPQLNPGAFGYIIYGVDILNAGAPFGVEDQGGPYWSNTRITAADDSPFMWWAASYDPNQPNAANAAVHLWGTMDYGSLFETDIWDLSLFQTRGLEIGLCYRNGVLYLGGYATLVGDPDEVFNVFYSKSTDDGETWTAPEGPFLGVGDWRDLPEMASLPYDDWEEHLSFDMQVDYLGRVHFLGVVEDLDDPQADLAVVDIREGPSGWEAEIVANNLAASTRTDYNGIDQMGYHVGSAMSVDGTVMGAVWLSAGAPGDSLPEIWLSMNYRSSLWHTPENVSQTPYQAELLLQAAPILREESDLYTFFLARAYQQGSDLYPPDDLAPASIYLGTVLRGILIMSTDEGFGGQSAFRLAQNYPNPFNGQTRISYTVGSRESAVLRVYDVLGREVATLVDEPKDAGTHNVSWDAAGLPSGVYYYRLHAGGYLETRRLVLLR